MKFLKNKIMVLLCALLGIFYFANDSALIDIEKTAIVVAIGIDETEDGYEVTAQIAVPQSTETASENNDAVLTAKGKTVFEAIENVGSRSGWHQKLSFCGMVILGRSVAERSAVAIVDHIIESEKFENSTLLIVADATAREILFSTTPLDAVSSFALQKIVLKNEWMTDPVNVTNVKTFAAAHYSASNSAFLPVVKVIKGDNQGKEGASSAVTASTGSQEGSDSSEGAGGSGSGSGSGSGGKPETVIFDASSTALFKNGKYVCTLDKRHTQALYLIKGSVKNNYASIENDGENDYLYIDKCRKSFSVDVKDAPTVNISLKLYLRKIDSSKATLLNENDEDIPSEKLLSATKSQYEKTIKELCETLCRYDCDVLGVKEYNRKFNPSFFRRNENSTLKDFDYSISVQTFSVDRRR